YDHILATNSQAASRLLHKRRRQAASLLGGDIWPDLAAGHPETTVRQAGGSRTCSGTPCLANLQPMRSRSLTDHDVLLDDDAEASREVEQVFLIIQRQPRFGRAARETHGL